MHSTAPRVRPQARAARSTCSSLVIAALVAAAMPAAALAATAPAPGIVEARVVVIVNVPRPWYAFDFLVQRGFRNAVPAYLDLPGLEYKMFTQTDDGQFGGIYLWRTAAQAQAYYDPGWRARVQQRYGKAAQVTLYNVTEVVDFRAAADQGALYQRAAAVATLAPVGRVDRSQAAAGDELRRYRVHDATAEPMEITLWRDRATAERMLGRSASPGIALFDSSPALTWSPASGPAAALPETEFFAAPVLMPGRRP